MPRDGTETAPASHKTMPSRNPSEASLNKESPIRDVPPGTYERVMQGSEEVPLLRSPVFWTALAILIALGVGLYLWQDRAVLEETAPAQQSQPAPAPEAAVAEPTPAPEQRNRRSSTRSPKP